MNPTHFRSISCPPNSPQSFRAHARYDSQPYQNNADESESDEIYADVSIKEEGQGNTKPIAIPKRREERVSETWNIVFFGD